MAAEQSAGRIEVEVALGLVRWLARAARIEEGMSRTGGAWIDLALGADVDFERLLEQEAVVTVSADGAPVRRHTMRLAGARFVEEKDGHLRYQLELRPALWFLRLEHDVRKFRDQTTEAIVSKILDEGGVPHAWRTGRACDRRPYCVQYRETDLAFVSRLLELEGIWYAFEPDGTMVLGDDSRGAPPVPGKATYRLSQGAGAESHGELAVTSFRRGARIGSGKATVNDFNWKKPRVSLLASATGARDQALEVYDYPAGYRDQAAGALLSRLRLEALLAGKRFAEGTSTVAAFEAARAFTMDHAEAVSFDGRWLLTAVAHEYSVQDEQVRYENAWRAIPAEVPFRPPLVTPRPVVAGHHTAMVRGPAGEEIHTDRFGRAKVQFHWDREATGEDDSRWIRTLQETSTSIALARVGWEMTVGYIDGDPDRPIGLARHINGHMTPSYAQPAHQNRMTIRSETYPGKAGYCELRIDDSAGAMAMDWHAQKDWRNLVKHDRSETIGNDLTVLVKQGSERVVGKSQTVTIGANERRAVGKDEIAKVEKDRSVTVAGSESIHAGKDADLDVSGDDAEKVGGVRFTKTGSFSLPKLNPKQLIESLVPSARDVVGGAAGAFARGAGAAGGEAFVTSKLGAIAFAFAGGGALTGQGSLAGVGSALKGALPTPQGLLGQATGGISNIRSIADLAMFLKGSITRSVQKSFTRAVGAAQVAIAGGTISHEAGAMLVEAVGGAKLTLAAKEGIHQGVAGWMASAVGGLVLRKAKGDMSVSAKQSSVRVGGAASFTSKQRIELRGAVVDVVALQGLTLGDESGLLIDMAPSVTTIKGEIRLKSEDGITVTGKPDRLAR